MTLAARSIARREPLLLVGAVLVPFVVGPWILGSVCMPLARTLAEPLTWAGFIVHGVPTKATDERALAPSAEPSDEAPPDPGPSPAAGSKGVRRRHVEVSAELVRRAVPAERRPSGVLVGRRDGKPAGIEIRRTGALGGLVRTGDIVVDIEGRPIASWEVLVGAVRAAYDRGAEAVDGTMWRSGATLTVRVHLPR
jgi:hypothetical protein